VARKEDPERNVANVGRRIAELRQAAGMTQEEFARALRSTPRYVHQLEAGVNLTIHSLTKIANALGVPSIRLWEPTTYRRPTRGGRPPKTTTRP
jgi:transcriptional regulator with XRE-family HTH domain